MLASHHEVCKGDLAIIADNAQYLGADQVISGFADVDTFKSLRMKC